MQGSGGVHLWTNTANKMDDRRINTMNRTPSLVGLPRPGATALTGIPLVRSRCRLFEEGARGEVGVTVLGAFVGLGFEDFELLRRARVSLRSFLGEAAEEDSEWFLPGLDFA